jgi:hypothetical protein
MMIPYVIDDIDLSLAAFRLYAHLKRVAGEDGVCWQSQALLENHCHMTGRTVVKAKKELESYGLIKIDRVKDKHKVIHQITIVDIWAKNHRRYKVPV